MFKSREIYINDNTIYFVYLYGSYCRVVLMHTVVIVRRTYIIITLCVTCVQYNVTIRHRSKYSYQIKNTYFYSVRLIDDMIV